LTNWPARSRSRPLVVARNPASLRTACGACRIHGRHSNDTAALDSRVCHPLRIHGISVLVRPRAMLRSIKRSPSDCAFSAVPTYNSAAPLIRSVLL
jgi:hypothetical protein